MFFMKQITAKYDKRENELKTTSDRVIANMDNNPDFSDAPPALAELKKVLPEFTEARANAKGRDITMVSIKNDKKAIVLDLLQQLADYVNVKSKGDRTMILSSGFYATSDDSGNNEPPSIGSLEVELGQSGEVTTRAKNVAGAKAYVHQYTKEPPGTNTEWIGEGSSSANHTFEGMMSDKRYWFRVVAIGVNKQKAYSPVVSRVIQ
jgi:hypothetical protein